MCEQPFCERERRLFTVELTQLLIAFAPVRDAHVAVVPAVIVRTPPGVIVLVPFVDGEGDCRCVEPREGSMTFDSPTTVPGESSHVETVLRQCRRKPGAIGIACAIFWVQLR